MSVPFISNFLRLSLATGLITLASVSSAIAETLNVDFTKLEGVTGGNPALTGVYRANLSNLGFDINSIAIADSNSAQGGQPGKFSGFDLDAIKISNVLVNNATDAKNLLGLDVFDFTPSGTLFIPGNQRSSAEPTGLFGTRGGNIDNSIATLQNFDANASADANAFGLVSLGDGGKVVFNLKNPISNTTPLYLYIGEAGDNGEVASGQITVSDNKPQEVPEPTTLAALSLLGIYLAANRRKKTKTA
jgi:hypothetical protein